MIHEPPLPPLPRPARARALEGTGELLLAELRLHTRRVRALAASLQREASRPPAEDGAGLDAISARLDDIAGELAGALSTIETAVVATFAGLEGLYGAALGIEVGVSGDTPAERVATTVRDLSYGLRTRHRAAQAALRGVAEGLTASANSLTIAAGRPGPDSDPGSMEVLRVMIRQMRLLGGVTAAMGGRLDVFAQNVAALLRDAAPRDAAEPVAPPHYALPPHLAAPTLGGAPDGR